MTEGGDEGLVVGDNNGDVVGVKVGTSISWFAQLKITLV